MANIIVIGGGLTGLSAAYHFEKRGFFDYLMLEKEDNLGGLCRSVYQDGFTFDYTGHLLHVNDSYFYTLLSSIIGISQLNTITRRSFIFSESTYTKYPYQINLYGLPIKTIADCIQGFITRKPCRKKNVSFYDWVLEHFGTGIAQSFFIPFQQKIFDYDIKKITSTWTGRFVPQTSLEQMIEGACKDMDPEQQNIGYNSSFFYPKQGGILYLVNKLASTIKNPIYLQSPVKKIDMEKKVITLQNGNTEPYNILINTMPLNKLLQCLKTPSHINFSSAQRNLACNSVVNFNLGFSYPDLSDKHWIYFPESRYPFYRLGFPHNFSPTMAPQGCSSLYGEFAYFKKDEAFVQEKLKQSLAHVKKLFNIDDSLIATEKIIRIPHAYVIFNQWREQNLSRLLHTLESNAIYSVGRYGEWKYSSMQEAILDGKKIAEKLTILPAKQLYETVPALSEKQKEI